MRESEGYKILSLLARTRVETQTHYLLDMNQCSTIFVAVIGGKAIPLQAWTGLEGSRRLRLPDFKTIGT